MAALPQFITTTVELGGAAVYLGIAIASSIGAALSARVLVNLIKEGPAVADRALAEGHSLSNWWQGGPVYDPAIHRPERGAPVLVGRRHPQFGTVMEERFARNDRF